MRQAILGTAWSVRTANVPRVEAGGRLGPTASGGAAHRRWHMRTLELSVHFDGIGTAVRGAAVEYSLTVVFRADLLPTPQGAE
jgi:hypothetical protein